MFETMVAGWVAIISDREFDDD
uniref:Uncharacterized protein n=1 Tax=Vitis vinifera TaxID=29760 RepID=F6HWK7_VITVI